MTTQFRELPIGETFDFVSPNRNWNSFYLRCKKISARKYRDSSGIEHRVGTVNCPVFHIGEDSSKD